MICIERRRRGQAGGEREAGEAKRGKRELI